MQNMFFLLSFSVLLIFSQISRTDIYISLDAELVNSPCSLTMENGKNSLNINFNNIIKNNFSQAVKYFSIRIANCDLNKNFKIYLSPRGTNTFNVNNEIVLATSTKGLGIRFIQKNNGNVLNLLQWQKITTECECDTALLVLQSQLVSNRPFEELTSGPFHASVSIRIDYL